MMKPVREHQWVPAAATLMLLLAGCAMVRQFAQARPAYAPLAVSTFTRQASPPPAPSPPRPDGVICTVVKDETRHLVEWVQFHLTMGATKVVVYDDGSADSNSPAKLLQPFGSSVVVNKVQDLGPIPADFWPEHAVAPFIQRMFWAYNHCGATYGGGKGWMAIMDTDEYLFPCRRDVSSNLQEAFAERLARSSLDALGVQVECLKFGFNDVNRSLTPGELQIEFHTHRAPYVELEPHVVSWAQQSLTGCKFPQVCYNQGAYKQVYKLEVAPEAKPTIHEPTSDRVRARLDRQWSRQYGICCNHYMLRATPQEMLEKASKTQLLDLYKPKLQPDPIRWFTTVSDTLIWQHLSAFKADMKERDLLG